MVSVKKNKSFSDFNVYVAALIVNLSATAATCVMSWSNPTIPIITKPGARIFVTTKEASLLSSLALGGAAFGPFINGQVIDHLGRKWTIICVMWLLILSWGVMYFSDILVILYIARFVAGIGVGCVYGTLPMYIAEMAPPKLRGTLCSLLQLFDCFAYLIVYIIGGRVSYEILIVASAALPLLSIVTIIWVPESPYHLHNKGKVEEALRALRFFRGYAEVSTLQREIADMEASAKNIEENKGSLKVLFTKKGYLKCLYYSLGLLFFQQMSGVNVITCYSQSIFEAAGSSSSPNLQAIIVALVMTFTSVLTITVTKFVRIKKLLAYSAAGGVFGMFFLGGYFYLKDHGVAASFGWVPVASLVLYIFCYTLGLGPLSWVTTSETYPSHLKAVGCNLSASFCWFLSFLLTCFFMPVAELFGEAPIFITFGCFCIVGFIFIVFQLPDTHGKTFQEIQDMIQGTKTAQNLPIKEKKDNVC